MTDGKPGGLGLFRPQRSVPAKTGSLTRRALMQRTPAPTVRERFLGFDWGRFMRRSFALLVALPAAAFLLYSELIASPVYTAEARFAVRNASDRPLVEAYLATGAMDALPSPSADRQSENGAEKGAKRTRAPDGMAAGARASQIASLALGAIVGTRSNEPFIVANFLKSADIVQALDGDGWLRSRFRAGDPDWLHRLPADASAEELQRYWRSSVTAAIDINTGLIVLSVSAFTPEDSLAITERALRQCEALVNRLAERGRRDRLAAAEDLVARAEHRYLTAEAAMRTMRADTGLIDPVAEAKGALELLLQLVSARVELDMQLRIYSESLADDAPQVRSLRKRIAALDAEIAKAKATLTDAAGDADAAANYIARFEEAETERRLSSMLYSTALDGLERARLESERQANYLAVFAPPYLPESASGPRILGTTLALFAAALLLWGLFVLAVAAARQKLG